MNFNHNTFSGRGKIKHGVPQASALGPLLFLCTNNVPKIIHNKSKQILFAVDS
jgi:hypothetical protein